MSLFDKLLRRSDPRDTMVPLYNTLVARARAPHWYQDGGVPDTLDGRFDMVALVLSLTLIRLERDDPQGSVWLTELFVNDMDAQVRQIGFGDMVVGKHIGKMMAALGGRLDAYRAAPDSTEFREALVRNLFRGENPGPAALDHVARAAAGLVEQLAATPADRLKAGEIA